MTTPAIWLKKFYPVPSTRCKKKDALTHSLRKWEGLRPEVLTEHGLTQGLYKLYDSNDEQVLSVTSTSCALCHFYYDAEASDEEACMLCPLFAVNKASCDDAYQAFKGGGNPEPMITLIKQAIENEND